MTGSRGLRARILVGLRIFPDEAAGARQNRTVTPMPEGGTQAMSGPREVRASDAERELCVERLGRAMSQGRLRTEEFEERVRAAWAATTRAELAALTRDLPGHLW